MRSIHQLPQQLISKIAAGEVIERPMYAVKELIENSIDAESDSIIVHIEDSGLKRITIIDNGKGMSLEDLEESFKPHTTSKIATEEDLHAIQTLGFRGEALSSIAAISKLIISSRNKNSTSGNSIVIVEGQIEKVAPMGMPTGTHITVENLFYPVPARKKFLKGQRTEFRHILETVMHFAFSHPDVRFVLTHNGKTIIDLPKAESLISRIQSLLGNDIYSNLIPVSFEDSYISLSGFLVKPQITTKTPHKQFLYINGRKIHDKGISSTVKSAYGTLLEKQVYPVCLLFLTIPYEVVDVNVHPKKEEVRFIDTRQMLDTIEKAVVKTFAEHDMSFDAQTWKREILLGDVDQVYTGKSTQSYAGKLLKEQQLPWKLLQRIKTDPTQIIQTHSLYLVANTDTGVAFIDQHAAHERILYEQFQSAFLEKRDQQTQHVFETPKILSLTPSDSELVTEHIDTMLRLGFGIEHFKGNSFLLRSVPKILQDKDPSILISEVLENMRIDAEPKKVDSSSRQMIAYLACRSAVKAGDSLTKAQCKDLIEQLEKTPNNATCPHGRPTRVMIDISMINKMFKRQ